jgi:tRNA C32,U32 (ribose-2'-O)-methylase TrmJ
LDEQPVNNANYYRLKQMDIDEAYEYSNIVLIDNQLPMDNSIFNIYPNPVSYELAVNSTDIIERVIIYNTLGQVVKEVIISDTQFSIDVSDLPEGIYTLQAQKANGQLVVKQFVK